MAENSIDIPSFGNNTIVSYDSAEHGINPENEHIIIDTTDVVNPNGLSEKWAAIRRLDSVRIIAEKEGEIYFAKQTSPNGKTFYTAFGGSVLSGESPEKAAKRELLEESGMDGELELLMTWKNPDSRLKWTWFIYIARNVQKVSSQHLDAMENIEVVKVKNFNEFLKIMSNAHLKDNPNKIPFKDGYLLEILNNYTPINPLMAQALNNLITKKEA